MELYTTYHAKFVKTTEWAQKNTASKLTVLNILILNYYFLFFCKNVGIVIPLSLTCGVTGDGCLSPGSGASFDTEDVLAAGCDYVYCGLTLTVGLVACAIPANPAIALLTLPSSRPVAITVIVA